MSLKCHIVKDLFPNYIEHLTSEETNQEIESHLEQCLKCRNEYHEMNKPVPKIEQGEQDINKKEINYLKKCSKIVKRSLITIGILVALIVVIVISGVILLISGWVEKDKVHRFHIAQLIIYNHIIPVNSSS